MPEDTQLPSASDVVRRILADMPQGHPVTEAFLAAVAPGAAVGAALTGTDPGQIAASVLALAGPVGAALASQQQQEANLRLSYCIRLLARDIEQLRTHGIRVTIDPQWVDLLSSTIPLIAHTASEQKRERFSRLLLNGALTKEPEQREQGRAMAALLDQFEFHDVHVLDKLMQRPASQPYDALWGATRDVTIERSDFNTVADGMSLLRLQGLGLLTIEATATKSPQSLNTQVKINSLGLRFHKWVSDRPTVAP